MSRLSVIRMLLAAGAAALACTGVATAGTSFGVAEDASKWAEDGGSNMFLLLNDLGLTANRVTVNWDPTDGNQGLTIRERGFLDRLMPVAAIRGIDIVLSVYPARAKVFSVDTQKRIELFGEFLELLARRYPQVTKFIVGNEPNQPRFVQPQFVRVGPGRYRPTAAALYARVLAVAYDALKAVNPEITAVGLGLSPRGNDDPRARSNVSRSPVRFIHDLALAYRRSGRERPLMDAFGFHPYPRSNDDPLWRGYNWPNGGLPNLNRIKQAVWDGFHGTAQPLFPETPQYGIPPPRKVLGLELDEYGRQVQLISSVARAYHGRENVRTISEGRQANLYAAVVRRVACDPAVTGFFFFHFIDEPDLDRFQSGLVRVDGTKRPAYAAVKEALAQTKGECPGALRRWRHSTTVAGAEVTFEEGSLTVAAAEDVAATAGVFPAALPRAEILEALIERAASVPGLVVRGHRPRTLMPARADFREPYVHAVVLRALMNPGRTFLAVSDPVPLGRG
jgi:hypothetical protein